MAYNRDNDGQSSRDGQSGRPQVRRQFFRRRKTCPFSGQNAMKIDYKDIRTLSKFVSERGKNNAYASQKNKSTNERCLNCATRSEVFARNKSIHWKT